MRNNASKVQIFQRKVSWMKCRCPAVLGAVHECFPLQLPAGETQQMHLENPQGHCLPEQTANQASLSN